MKIEVGEEYYNNFFGKMKCIFINDHEVIFSHSDGKRYYTVPTPEESPEDSDWVYITSMGKVTEWKEPLKFEGQIIWVETTDGLVYPNGMCISNIATGNLIGKKGKLTFEEEV